MARIRSIRPESCTDERLADCSTNARLLFVFMQCFCDDGGVHPAKPRTLKAEVFPMDDFSAEQVSGWVGELLKARLLTEFEADGEEFWLVNDWSFLQKIDRPSLKYPRPPEPNSTTAPRVVDESSSNDRRALDEDSTDATPRSGGREGVESVSTRTRRHTAASRGSRIPQDWQPDESAIEYASKLGLVNGTLVAEVEKFRDHWTAKAGKDAVKVDWPAAWRTWCRKSVEFASAKQGPKGDSADDLFRRGAA